MQPSDYQPLPREAHAFIDGLLSAEAEQAFRRRLEKNQDLQGRVDELRRARNLLHDLPMATPPANFDEGVFSRIKATEIAHKARKRISSAPVPLWQHIVQVGAGAAAAVLVLSLTGLLPGASVPLADPNEGWTAEGEMAALTEEDLLPLLGDQYERFRELSRHVSHLPVEDPTLRRELIRYELSLSDIGPRAYRLGSLLAGLPLERRREYRRFLDGLMRADAEIDAELIASRRLGRAPEVSLILASLEKVAVPVRLASECNYRLVRSGTGPTGFLGRSDVDTANNNDEASVYAKAREASYDRDYELAARLYGAYLESFSRSPLAPAARVSRVVAQYRAGDLRAAVAGYRKMLDTEGTPLAAFAGPLQLMDNRDRQALALAADQD